MMTTTMLMLNEGSQPYVVLSNGSIELRAGVGLLREHARRVRGPQRAGPPDADAPLAQKQGIDGSRLRARSCLHPRLTALLHSLALMCGLPGLLCGRGAGP